MAKGTIGKQQVIAKIAEAFGSDFIGEVDKKVYVWTTENGERIQIAMALTCPKIMVAAADPQGPGDADIQGNFDWSNDVEPEAPLAAPATISQEEIDTVKDLMAKLGL